MCTHACEVSEGRQSKQYNNQIGGDILPIKACTLGTRHTEYVAWGSVLLPTEFGRIDATKEQNETNVSLESVSSTNDNHSSQEVDNTMQ